MSSKSKRNIAVKDKKEKSKFKFDFSAKKTLVTFTIEQPEKRKIDPEDNLFDLDQVTFGILNLCEDPKYIYYKFDNDVVMLNLLNILCIYGCSIKNKIIIHLKLTSSEIESEDNIDFGEDASKEDYEKLKNNNDKIEPKEFELKLTYDILTDIIKKSLNLKRLRTLGKNQAEMSIRTFAKYLSNRYSANIIEEINKKVEERKLFMEFNLAFIDKVDSDYLTDAFSAKIVPVIKYEKMKLYLNLFNKYKDETTKKFDRQSVAEFIGKFNDDYFRQRKQARKDSNKEFFARENKLFYLFESSKFEDFNKELKNIGEYNFNQTIRRTKRINEKKMNYEDSNPEKNTINDEE